MLVKSTSTVNFNTKSRITFNPEYWLCKQMSKIGSTWQTLTRKDMDPLECVTYEMLKTRPGNTC